MVGYLRFQLFKVLFGDFVLRAAHGRGAAQGALSGRCSTPPGGQRSPRLRIQTAIPALIEARYPEGRNLPSYYVSCACVCVCVCSCVCRRQRGVFGVAGEERVIEGIVGADGGEVGGQTTRGCEVAGEERVIERIVGADRGEVGGAGVVCVYLGSAARRMYDVCMIYVCIYECMNRC